MVFSLINKYLNGFCLIKCPMRKEVNHVLGYKEQDTGLYMYSYKGRRIN